MYEIIIPIGKIKIDVARPKGNPSKYFLSMMVMKKCPIIKEKRSIFLYFDELKRLMSVTVDISTGKNHK